MQTQISIAHDICSALHYLHMGRLVPIVHRDLKPGNIFMDRGRVHAGRFLLMSLIPAPPTPPCFAPPCPITVRFAWLGALGLGRAVLAGRLLGWRWLVFLCSNYHQAFVGDFGCSREGPSAGTFCGTIAYMAPEVVQQQNYFTTADMFSFGAIMYEVSLSQEATRVSLQLYPLQGYVVAGDRVVLSSCLCQVATLRMAFPTGTVGTALPAPPQGPLAMLIARLVSQDT